MSGKSFLVSITYNCIIHTVSMLLLMGMNARVVDRIVFEQQEN